MITDPEIILAIKLAEITQLALAWDEALDGDATARIAKAFLKELNKLNGNI